MRLSTKRLFTSVCLASTGIGLALSASAPALAKPLEPVEVGDGVTVDPILDTRLRIESIDSAKKSDTATAITIRTRAGAELSYQGFSLLGELEGTSHLTDDFDDTIASNGVEPFPVVADPENFEINRLAIGYANDTISVTIGRQRLIHDNARFLGNVGWRQNEQTFDAVRSVVKLGPVKLDASFANSQRTIFGSESANQEFEGNLALFHADADVGGVKLSGFSYLIDYDTRVAFSSQTYGFAAKGSIPAGSVKLTGRVSYATQSDYGDNPVSYSADYFTAEIKAAFDGFTLKAGYEELGSDGGVAAFQTPLATAHKFNGLADLFLTTPDSGLRDFYVSAAKSFQLGDLPKMKAQIVRHSFDSDFGAVDYGYEWDASLSFKLGHVAVKGVYNNYQASGFSSDKEKFALQFGVAY